MTNLEIIKAETLRLQKAGKIPADAEIHTYNHWKHLGFQVLKGQKAVARLVIWKHANKADDEDDNQTGKMFRKTAYFFSSQQVFKIDED